MGKHGPCCHCGVTSTPLWRNGPPEKPVLCNACGSRWRTKGTLAKYTPLHSRAEPDDLVDKRVPKVKIISSNKNKEVKLLKRKLHIDNVTVGGMNSPYNNGYRKKVMDEDISNRSSSGSAISNPESCAQFGGTDASDFSGQAQSIVWDSMVPSKKRTCVSRTKASSVEKLTKDLHTILHKQQSSYLSGSSEEDLIFESETPMVSVEIGHGGVLIRHPSEIAKDEESEASSLSVDNKFLRVQNETYSRRGGISINNESKGVNFPRLGIDKIKSSGLETRQEEMAAFSTELLEKSWHEEFQFLASCDSPLRDIDLKDVLNYEELMIHLTNEEHQELLKYLPAVDTVGFPNSLKSMFDSDQFKESLSCFQQLLAEGVFDKSLAGVKAEDCKTLKKLALFNLTKSQWVERYNLLKKCENSTASCNVSGGSNVPKPSKFVNIKKSRDGEHQKFQEELTTMKSPKRVNMKASYENKETVYNTDSSCFSPRNLFSLPTDNSSLMLDSFQYGDDSSEQDLLFDVPSNNSFPLAELLPQNSNIGF